jgi:deazaflavin-dependent oxidoreductase (nitroreductase family)
MDIEQINTRVIAQFRSGGPIEGMNRDRLLLLTTTGARTGVNRTTPMMFHRDGDRLLVIASNIGAPRHPDWYLNLAANPSVVVDVGSDRFEATAVPLTGIEREQVWTMLKQRYSFFAEHEAKTSREIPVVALSKTAAPSAV